MSRRILQFSRNQERHLYISGGLQVITGSSPYAQLAGYSISFAEVGNPQEDQEETSQETDFSEEDSQVICRLEKISEQENCDVYLTRPLQTTTQESLFELLEELEEVELPETDFDVDAILNELFANTQG